MYGKIFMYLHPKVSGEVGPIHLLQLNRNICKKVPKMLQHFRCHLALIEADEGMAIHYIYVIFGVDVRR